ncbi:MAG TPA: tRNA (adenosine(37)-N6)-threonylcarbamoyltransferase complex dimerization subunit type 1 TsaB [Nevskiaceae bacterium]|nr:tRNA (adenosine(37)-N6)-threonylcarbamoyltransferase complex dimerization subunit type 1 TsaB [Nevskiaceae bacterium]
MKYLALDTTTEVCSVALNVDGVPHQILETTGQQASKRLPAMVHEILSSAGIAATALDGLVCCVGPGGFAGVRVGMAYAKGLALGLNVPIAPVSSLALLAQAAIRKRPAPRCVVSAIDARMGEVYVADYRLDAGGQLNTAGEQVCAPEQWHGAAALSDTPFTAAGSGWKRYAEVLARACGSIPELILPDAVPEAIDAFALVAGKPECFVDAAALEPVYLRNHVALTLAERGVVLKGVDVKKS